MPIEKFHALPSTQQFQKLCAMVSRMSRAHMGIYSMYGPYMATLPNGHVNYEWYVRLYSKACSEEYIRKKTRVVMRLDYVLKM